MNRAISQRAQFDDNGAALKSVKDVFVPHRMTTEKFKWPPLCSCPSVYTDSIQTVWPWEETHFVYMSDSDHLLEVC